MTAASQEELPQEAGAANDEMREREGVDAEVRQLPDQVLRDKAQCIREVALVARCHAPGAQSPPGPPRRGTSAGESFLLIRCP